MKSSSNWTTSVVLMLGTLYFALAVSTTAQIQTETSTTAGRTTMQVQMERGEVVLVDGNDLVVKMEDGTIRHFPNVSESAKVTVDGKQLGIHDLKPGMKLTRATINSSTPQTVTTVQTVTGKVWHVSPPKPWRILALEDGTNQSFKIPNGQKFTIDGQQVDAFGLEKGNGSLPPPRSSRCRKSRRPKGSMFRGLCRQPHRHHPQTSPSSLRRREPTPTPSAVEPAAGPQKTLPKTASNCLLSDSLLVANFCITGSQVLRLALGH